MKLFFPLGMSLFLYSCVNTKRLSIVWIPRNQIITERVVHSQVDNPVDSVKTILLSKGVKAIVTVPTEAADVLKIQLAEDISGKFQSRSARLFNTESDPPATGYYYAGSPLIPKNSRVNQVFSIGKFKYLEISQVIQALSVPLKYRPRFRDTISSTAVAYFTVAFAYAFKFTKNTYKKIYWNNNGKPTALTQRVSKVTYAFGPLFGPTVIDLSASNTDGFVKKDRSVIGASYGAFAVIAYNQFNVGLSLGFDNSFSTENHSWIYNGRPWIGIVLALDLIK